MCPVRPNRDGEIRLRPGAAGQASTVRVHRSVVVTGGSGFAGQPSPSAPSTYAGALMPALPRASDGLPPGAFMVLRDRLGSADLVLDHQGAVVTDYNYAPFGRMMHAHSSGMDLEYSKYTDKPDDDAIGMQFFGARYYDPRLRRFISPDPVIPGGGTDARGFNPYAYNLNNPFRWVDPDGHAPDEPQGPGQPSSRWEAFAESAGAFVSALELRYQAAKSAVADSASAWISDAWTSAQARMRGHLERQAAASSTPGQTDLVARPAENVVRQEVTERGQALAEGGVDLGRDVVVGIGVGKAIGVGATAPKLLGPGTRLGEKIVRQMSKRGWTRRGIQDAISDPARTVSTRNVRHLAGGHRLDDPATAFYGREGGYVVRNDRTGDVVQVSDRRDPNWKAPWD